jgi:regulator of sirC expression with transglutaminase-like and TPR domain
MKGLLDLLAGRSAELELDRAALELARIEFPQLQCDPFIGMLDAHAVELGGRLDGRRSGRDYVEAANDYLFGELGFRGNTANYYDPRNSCLNEVLTARTGIPIALAVVYLEIGRRLGQPVCGIGLPGHFLVQYRGSDFTAFIDVFGGGRFLTAGECFDVARKAGGTPRENDARLLAPVSKREIVIRMLRNLRNVYLMRRSYGKALETLNLLLEADTGAAEEFKQRGLVHLRRGNLAAACADLERYLRLAPDAPDSEEIAKQLRAARNGQARLN